MTYELIEKLVAFLVEERRLCPRYGGDDRYGKIDSLIAEVRAARAESVQSHEVWVQEAEQLVTDHVQAVEAFDAAIVLRSTFLGKGKLDCIKSKEVLSAHLRTHPALAVPELSSADIETIWRAHAPCNIVDYGASANGVNTWLVEMVKAMIAERSK